MRVWKHAGYLEKKKKKSQIPAFSSSFSSFLGASFNPLLLKPGGVEDI